MRLSTLALCLAATTLLTGCNALHRNIERANDDLYNGGKKTRAKLASYIYEEEAPPVQPAPPPQRYCYDVRSDIVCYDQPRPPLRTQRVGTSEAEVAPDVEYEISQMFNPATRPSGGGIVSNPNQNLGNFFNPARPDMNNDLRFNNAAGRTNGAFVPEAPPVRGVNDPVSNAPNKKDTFGFSQQGKVKSGSAPAPVSTMDGGPATMNTQGPPPSRPPKGFEGAPSPLIETF